MLERHVDPVHAQHARSRPDPDPQERSGAARLRRRALELERRERQLLAELSSVLGAVDAGILTVDEAGRVRSQNDVAVGILGGRIDDLASAFGPFGAQGRPFDRPAAPDTVESPSGTDGLQHETTELQLVCRPDRWLVVTRYGRTSDDTTTAVVIQDVTEDRRGHGLRDAFVGMLSHELRTPVTSIYAAANLLRCTSSSLDTQERAGLVDDISEEAERLLRLVDDLLVLAHFDEGISLIQEPSLLQRVVPGVVDGERRRWPALHIDLRIDPQLPVVRGDETSVRQVVRNLISNAAKYGNGEQVVVELHASGDEPGAIVRVLDRGPGVTPSEAEALFRPFFRSSRTAHGSSGAGVGLYVCRRLVEAMGGHIWARPREGGGSDFGFWLPEYAYDHDEEAAADRALALARPGDPEERAWMEAVST